MSEDYAGTFEPPEADASCPRCKKDSCPGCDGRVFEQLEEGRYRLTIGDAAASLEIDRLRRRSGELVGELTVRTTIPGAATFGDVLSVSDFNLSSQRARDERGKYLAQRARTDNLDWTGWLEELAQRVVTAERTGQPMIALRDVPRPAPDDSYSVDGFPLLKRHPEFVFGDGGAGKSLLALYLAGRLVETGLRVGLLDWELCVEDHRLRLEQLFGEQMPDVRYARCEAPLVFESDRVRRFVREERLDYLVFDSVAFACDGPPESAEVAGRYFRALRQLGAIGSLHVAHVSKAEGAEHRPFGSTFWHNGCRSSWFLKQAEGMPDARTINVALHHRKANLGRLRSAIGFEISFGDERTTFRRVDVADVPELAVGLSLKQRIAEALKPGALSISEIAERLDAKPDSVKHAVNRGKGRIFAFVSGPGGQRIGLLQRER